VGSKSTLPFRITTGDKLVVDRRGLAASTSSIKRPAGYCNPSLRGYAPGDIDDPLTHAHFDSPVG